VWHALKDQLCEEKIKSKKAAEAYAAQQKKICQQRKAIAGDGTGRGRKQLTCVMRLPSR